MNNTSTEYMALVEMRAEIEELKKEIVSLKKALASCDPEEYDGHALLCAACGERLFYYNPHTELEERKPHKLDCLWIKAHEVFNVAD